MTEYIGQKKKLFEDVLTQAYDHKKYIGFLRELLNDVKLVAPNKQQIPYNTFSSAVEHYVYIGKYTGEDGNAVALYSVCLYENKSIENTRTLQRNFIKSLLEETGCAGALAAFYNKNEPEKWRFSLVRLDYEFAEGKISAKLTPAKRYSYLVGKNEPCHTAKERLFPIFAADNRNPGLNELEEAFSVEAVTKDFFEKYRSKYLDLKEYLDSNKQFTTEAQARGFDSEQFAKKLLGQIVFLYFIQKKGWLGVNAFPDELKERAYKNAFFSRGQKHKELLPRVYKQKDDGSYERDAKAFNSLNTEDKAILSAVVKGDKWGDGPKDFMRQIFAGCADKQQNFFDDYLEPLFYTGLNQNRGENAFFAPLHMRIPFLNGGLFEELNGYDWQHNNFNIPNTLFSNLNEKGLEADGILDVFDRYNFTISEDEPMEREVAIDPEMLGKIFENLLDVKDRKSKGAFYTPREIVHYMCRESLINYLTTNTQIPEDDIRKFVVLGEYFCDEDARKTLAVDNETGAVLQGSEIYSHKHHMEFDKNKELEIPETIFSFKKNINRLTEIDRLLSDIKVVDLAVGSGAFPLGMLNEIVKAREVITSYMLIEKNGYERLICRTSRSAYQLKRDTIRNCIFACDIEASATDITKLRLWLSLVIDNQIMDQNDELLGYFTKPRELPNLDCNIICGNSLIDEFCGIPLITENAALGNLSANRQGTTYDMDVELKLNELIALQSKLYDEKDHVAKDSLKEQIQEIYNSIVLKQLESNPQAQEAYYQAILQPSKPFVLWQIYFPKVFKEKGGFDVVIGNPPYVGEKGNKELFRPIAATQFGHKYYCGKMDLFYFFFHKAIDLGNKNAEISFITTNYYTTAYGGKLLRKDFKERTHIRQLINLFELKVFESALGQHNMITMLTKNNQKSITAHNCLCKLAGVASSNLLRKILDSLNNSNKYIETYSVEQENLYEGDEFYVRLSGCNTTNADSINSILNKISSTPLLLNTIASIKQGIVSGADKYTAAHEAKFGLNFPKGKGIFVLTKAEIDSLNLNQTELSEYVKPVYKNGQISKYHIAYDDSLWVLYMTKDTNVSETPNILDHLEQFRIILSSKRETLNGRLPWYSLNWAREKNIFEADEKIVNSRRATSNIFALETRHYFEQSDIMITVIKEDYSKTFPPKYILGLLNSKLMYVWLLNRGKLKGKLLELYGKPLEEIPVKEPTAEIRDCIVDCVIKILETEQENKKQITALMNIIDNNLYKLYNLSEAEIKIVEEINSNL